MNGKPINRHVLMKWVVPVIVGLLMVPIYVFAMHTVSGVTYAWCVAHNGDVWISDVVDGVENSHGDCCMERVKPGSTLGDVLAGGKRGAALGKSGYYMVRMSNGRVQKIKASEINTVKLARTVLPSPTPKAKSTTRLIFGDDQGEFIRTPTPTPKPNAATTINTTKSNTFRAAASPTPTPKAKAINLNPSKSN